MGIAVSHHRSKWACTLRYSTVSQHTAASRCGIGVASCTTPWTVRAKTTIVNLTIREISTILNIRRFTKITIIVECKVPTLTYRQRRIQSVGTGATSLHTSQRQVLDKRTTVQFKQCMVTISMVTLCCNRRMHNTAPESHTNNRYITAFNLNWTSFLIDTGRHNNGHTITTASYFQLKTGTTATTKIRISSRQYVTNLIFFQCRSTSNSTSSYSTTANGNVSLQTRTSSTTSNRYVSIRTIGVTRTSSFNRRANVSVNVVNGSLNCQLRTTNTVTGFTVITTSSINVDNLVLGTERTTRRNV